MPQHNFLHGTHFLVESKRHLRAERRDRSEVRASLKAAWCDAKSNAEAFNATVRPLHSDQR